MEECSICLSSLLDPHVLSCGHKFHEECIEGCRNRKCPLCRRDFILSTTVYRLKLEFNQRVERYMFIRTFPALSKDSFGSCKLDTNIIVFYFRYSNDRDKWYNTLKDENGLLNCYLDGLKAVIR